MSTMRRAMARLSSLLRAERGATAVEFAIVAPIFLALTLSTFEAGWLMTRSIMQDTAVNKVVRHMRINKDAVVTADAIKQGICDESMLFETCVASTMVELFPIRSASDKVPSDRAPCKHRGSARPFVAGGRGEFMFVRVCTSVKPITPFVGLAVALPDDATGFYGIVSKAAFVNEPE